MNETAVAPTNHMLLPLGPPAPSPPTLPPPLPRPAPSPLLLQAALRPLHLSPKAASRLPKFHPLSCSVPHVPCIATGDRSATGSGGNDSGRNGGKDDGGGGDNYYEEVEFDRLLGFDNVLRLAALRSWTRHDGGDQGCRHQGSSIAPTICR
jgi:hypothetical protein